jgi:hypothetical protein
VRIAPLTPDQVPAKLIFKQLDRAGEGRLRAVTLLRRAREIDSFCDGDEIANLLYFHCKLPLLLDFAFYRERKQF